MGSVDCTDVFLNQYEEKKMNRFENITKPLMWLMALLLAAFVAGCGGSSSSSSSNPAPSSAKAINTFSLAWTTGGGGLATGIIDPTLKTIKLTVPYNTVLTSLVATFTTTGASVTVDSGTGPVPQVSGAAQTPPIDYTNPVAYKVTGADGTWATYTVLVTVSKNTAKAIQTFTLAVSGVASIGTVIDEGITPTAQKTIAVTMPFGTTDLTALVATFTTTGAHVKVGTTEQVSGSTPNDFSAASGVAPVPVVYTVAAADLTTTTYNVTVSVALNSAKAITAFSLAAVSGVPASTATAITGTGTTLDPFDILVTMQSGTTPTDLKTLVATYTATGASSVMVGPTVQESTVSQNDFSGALVASGVSAVPVKYDVTAADSSTATYNVTVTVSAANPGPAGPSPALGTASTYGVFSSANAAVTLVDNSTTAGSLVNGNVGLMNGTGACNGCAVINKTVINGAIHNGDAAATKAQSDFQAAYADASVRATNACTVNTTELAVAQGACAFVTPTPPGTLTTFGLVTAPTYGPGLYVSGSTIGLGVNKTIFLDAGGNADAVFIFQAGSDITTLNGSKVQLINGAQAKNVWWIAGANATLGYSSAFSGTIITNGAVGITVTTGSTVSAPTVVEGRLLSAAAVSVSGFLTVNVPAP